MATPYIIFYPGETYRIESWYALNRGATSSMQVQFDIPDGTRSNWQDYKKIEISEGGKWVEFDTIYTHPANADTAVGSFAFLFNNQAGNTRFLFDDLKISATGPGIVFENSTCNIVVEALPDTAYTPENNPRSHK